LLRRSSPCKRISTPKRNSGQHGGGQLDRRVEAILKDVTAEKGGKFVMAHAKDDPANHARIKEFKASVRGTSRVDEYDGPGKCILTGEVVERRSAIAKAC
jgi:hypothetical protein